MKALSRIHLVGNQDSVKIAEPIETAHIMWAQMSNSARGSTFYFTRIDGHGKPKKMAVAPGAITRIEEL